jgi:hypothetical protein
VQQGDDVCDEGQSAQPPLLIINPAFSAKQNDVAGIHIASSATATIVFSRCMESKIQRSARNLQAILQGKQCASSTLDTLS